MNKQSIFYGDKKQIAKALARFILNDWDLQDYEVLKVNGLLPSQNK